MWHYGITQSATFNGVGWCGPLHLAFPGGVAYICTNIQQVAQGEEEEEEEGDTPHIDT